MTYYVRWKNKDGKIVISSFDSIIKARAKLINLYLQGKKKGMTPLVYDIRIFTNKACTEIDSFVNWFDTTLQTFTDKGRLVRQPFVWRHYNYDWVMNKDGTLTGELL